ncbi:MAG: hypothetical protein ACYSR0_09520, partial [Planctomycetota bacterium]
MKTAISLCLCALVLCPVLGWGEDRAPYTVNEVLNLKGVWSFRNVYLWGKWQVSLCVKVRNGEYEVKAHHKNPAIALERVLKQYECIMDL